MRGKPVHYDNKSLGDQLQDHNLAQQINRQTLGLAQGMNSFKTTVPLFGYKDGGIIQGPGTGTSDSIPAKLPVGGAIIPAHIVQFYGKDYFDKLEAAAPKAKGTQGKVDAKVSDGEYELSPAAVKHWGQEFITKLIDSDNEATERNDSPTEEAGEIAYAQGGVVQPDPNKPKEPTTFEKIFGTGTGPTPLDVLHGALSGKSPAEKPKGYADGGIVDTGFSAADKALGKNPSPLFTQNPNPPLLGLKNGMPDYGYGNRWDEATQSYSGPPKGVGYYGEVRRPDGNISGELGIGTNQGEIPSMVPGMTTQEMQTAITGGKYTDAMYDKADSHAAWRKLNGQSPWAGINDKQELLPTNRETIVSNALAHPNDPKSSVMGYKDGGIVEDQLPSLRDRAMNNAASNAEFRGRNPDFGNNFARDNAPAPSLSERVQTNASAPLQPAQTGLRGRLGMPESTVTPTQPQLGLRERVMSSAPAPEQVAQSGLRGRLGMPEAPAQPAITPTPSLRDLVFAPNNNTVRPGFGRNLPDSSVQMPKADPWLNEMQGAGGQGLGAKIGSMANKFAGAAGAAGSLAGIAAVAAEPSEGGNYLAARAARGDTQAQQALASGGFNPIAERMKAPINAGLAAVGGAINRNVIDPAVSGVKSLFAGNQEQPAPPPTQPNAVPQPVLAPAANQPQGLANVPSNPAPNPMLAPKNQYDFAQIPGGNRLQLTPEYNAQLNAQDTRTIAQRDATNATPEQIAGVQQSTLAPRGLGAIQQSSDNGGAFPVASKAEQDAYWNAQAEGQRLETLASKGRVLDPYTKQYLGQQNPNNFPAENQLARETLNQNIIKDNLDREAASSTAAAQRALELEKLNRDQFGAINEKQYDDMGTVKGETARIWNKNTGRFTDDEEVQHVKRISNNTNLALQFDSNPDQFDAPAQARIKAWLATPEGKNALALAKQNKQ